MKLILGTIAAVALFTTGALAAPPHSMSGAYISRGANAPHTSTSQHKYRPAPAQR
jgi:hypothetical protein